MARNPFPIRSTIAAIALVAMIGLALQGAAIAASLGVSPINLHVVAPAQAGAVSLANNGSAPVRLQVRIFKWRQQGIDPVLEPTLDVIASPPTTNIPAAATYTIRIARIAKTPIGTEESYRLIVDELPAAGNAESSTNSVRFLLRTSIPVFFAAKSAAPRVAWKLTSISGKLVLEASNTGDRHIKLTDLAIEGADGRIPFSAAGANAYLLPGSTARFEPLSPGKALTPGSVATITTAVGTPFAVKETITVSGV
jgi:fimbrial chaperone protein